LKPKIKSTMPSARIASPTMLFIVIFSPSATVSPGSPSARIGTFPISEAVLHVKVLQNFQTASQAIEILGITTYRTRERATIHRGGKL
jgi:hypothetical protein